MANANLHDWSYVNGQSEETNRRPYQVVAVLSGKLRDDKLVYSRILALFHSMLSSLHHEKGASQSHAKVAVGYLASLLYFLPVWPFLVWNISKPQSHGSVISETSDLMKY